MEVILAKIRQSTIGWLAYYSIADMKAKIREFNEWTRRRIRQIFWKQWKRIRTRYDNLIKLGADKGKAWEWANSRLGYWRVAGSPILATTLTNERLAKLGYDDISKRYEALHLNH